MMDKISVHQAGQNIAVYVDDMIVKLEAKDKHQINLEETFNTIQHYNLKLNPEKCSFNIQAEKFLGFKLVSIGIEVNPEKCKAIMEMCSPSSVKEI